MNIFCKIGVHNWEYIETIYESQLKENIISNQRGYPIPSYISHDRFENKYYKRVCLNCEKKEDTITPRTEEILKEYQKKNGRKELAIYLWEKDN